MKVLSVREPFASLIAQGLKKYETRSYNTKYRGEIYIHVSLNKSNLNDNNLQFIKQSAFGCIICRAKLVDSIYITEDFISDLKKNNYNEYLYGDYSVGRYAWVLEDVQCVTPIALKGELGLWNYYTMDEVMDKMKNVTYGYVDKLGYKYNSFEDFDKKYRLQSYKQLLKSEVGVCFDQVELERFYFKNYCIKTYFIEGIKNEQLQTHTFIAISFQNKYYWFEHAWEKYRGIYEFSCENEMLLNVIKLFKEEYNLCANDDLNVFEYKKPEAGMTLNDYFKWVHLGKPLNV